MNLSKETIDILKNFSTINPSVYVESGSLIQTTSPYENVFAFAYVSETFDKPFGIYELSRFLNIVSMMPNPEFDFDEKFVEIKSGRHSVKYQYASKDMIIYKKVDPNHVTSFEGSVNFTMSKNDVIVLRKAAALLDMPEAQFQCENGKIVVRAVDLENGTIDDWTTIITETEHEDTLPITFSFDSLKLIDGDYDVCLDANSPFGVFKGKEMPVVYAVSVRGDV